jgi:membrane protein implicated in regulation of membrane protease activity
VYVYRIMLLLVFSGYLLSPLLMGGWGDPEVAWYRPFAIWALLIALTAWLSWKRRQDSLNRRHGHRRSSR